MVQSIVDLENPTGLKVSATDIEDSVNDHSEEVITEELQDLQVKVQRTADMEVASDDEEEKMIQILRTSSTCGVKSRCL